MGLADFLNNRRRKKSGATRGSLKKEDALETWEHVQRLDPDDEEVRQMLNNLE